MFDGVFQNKYEDIRFYAGKLREHNVVPTMAVFDLSHMANFRRLVDDGELTPPYVFEFVFDVPSALPYSHRSLELLVDLLPEGAVWFCVRYHQRGAAALHRIIELGGNVRVGFEDSPFLSDGRRARSNVELVEDAVRIAEQAGRKVVRPSVPASSSASGSWRDSSRDGSGSRFIEGCVVRLDRLLSVALIGVNAPRTLVQPQAACFALRGSGVPLSATARQPRLAVKRGLSERDLSTRTNQPSVTEGSAGDD